MTFVTVIFIILTVSLVLVFVIRKRKSPISASTSSSDCSASNSQISRLWTSNCQRNKSFPNVTNPKHQEISLNAENARPLPKYIHPLSPTFIVTSTPVRNERTSFVMSPNFLNVQCRDPQGFSTVQCQDTPPIPTVQCLDTSEHNHSIGDIVDGNFVSFSNSDLYCINNSNSNLQEEEEKNDDVFIDISEIKSIDEKDRDILSSLCDNCRTSYCSNVSSTNTLTPSETDENEIESSSILNASSLSLKTLDADNEDDASIEDDDASICESVATVETIFDELVIDMDHIMEHKNILDYQNILEKKNILEDKNISEDKNMSQLVTNISTSADNVEAIEFNISGVKRLDTSL